MTDNANENPYAPATAQDRSNRIPRSSTSIGLCFAFVPSYMQFLELCVAVVFGVRTYETNYMVVAVFGGFLLSALVPFLLNMTGNLSLAVIFFPLLCNFAISVVHFAIACAIVPT